MRSVFAGSKYCHAQICWFNYLLKCETLTIVAIKRRCDHIRGYSWKNMLLSCIVEDAIQFERPVQNLVVDNPLLWISFQVGIDALHKNNLLFWCLNKPIGNKLRLNIKSQHRCLAWLEACVRMSTDWSQTRCINHLVHIHTRTHTHERKYWLPLV